MMLADAALTDTERMAIAIGCYAVSRTVHCMRQNPCALRAAPIMRLFIAEGLRGSKARGKIFNQWASDH
jgi:hypothetical protein